MDTEPYVALQTVMMPRDANPQGTIFGGVILGLIDMAAYVGAKRLVGALEVLTAGAKFGLDPGPCSTSSTGPPAATSQPRSRSGRRC